MLLSLVQTAKGSIRRSLAAEIECKECNPFRAYVTAPGARKPYGSTPQQSPFDAERIGAQLRPTVPPNVAEAPKVDARMLLNLNWDVLLAVSCSALLGRTDSQ